jgi:hypothetical protein
MLREHNGQQRLVLHNVMDGGEGEHRDGAFDVDVDAAVGALLEQARVD